MGKYIYVLLVVLILGVMGMGCREDFAVTYKGLDELERRQQEINSNLWAGYTDLNIKYNELKDENAQLKNQIDTIIEMHQHDTETWREWMALMNKVVMDMQVYGMPFRTTDRESYAQTGILIEISTIDPLQDNSSMSGRIIGRFNNIDEAIQYLESIRK